ncbi:PEP-CTERM sorting domain-containing protein [Leptolyngbya sp. PCC 6406]|uniref:PEP-CTERM sorting domain-containing protein n=1 Tax=Leptolyngbya sp. PCC 6406 TaxID=1173264 RepID=UPI0002ACA5D0|nr:PEP-CTERM sorting domain-containing protein [Leptolyngbya sp. PCC 6406]
MTIKNLAIFTGLATGAAVAFSALPAQAVTFSILDYQCPTATCVDLAAAGYNTSGGALIDPAGDLKNSYLTPGSDIGGPDTVDDSDKVTSYNITSRKNVPVGATSAIEVFDLKGAFDFFWGSVDTYNVVEFFKGGVSTGFVFTGSDIATAAGVGPANSSGNYHFDAYVLFEGDFDKAVLSVHDTLGTGIAFEVAAKTAVPEPASILGLVAMGLLGGGSLLKRQTQEA